MFIHHGSVDFGHYYLFIYDFEKNTWRKYNDSDVTEVPKSEVLNNRDVRNPPTPYFLVYVHDGFKDRLVQPVCREIQESQLSSQMDTSQSSEVFNPTQHMEELPAYNETSSVPPGMDSGDDRIIADENRPFSAKGSWDKKTTDRPDVIW